MAFSFSTTLSKTDFNKAAFNLLKKLEDTRTVIYLDSKNIPTIGVGFNVTDASVRKEVLRALGFDVDPRCYNDNLSQL